MSVERRDFLRISGAGLAGLALGGGLPRVTGSDPGDWEAVRGAFRLDQSWVHLTGLYLASHPDPVRTMVERYRDALDRNPVLFHQSNVTELDRRLWTEATAYTGAAEEELGFTDSTTMGTALLANGLAIRADQEMLVTTHDHRVTYQSLDFKSARSGAAVRRVPLYETAVRATETEVLTRLERTIRPSTRLLAATWVHSSTGVMLPIRAMSEVVARANRGRASEDRLLFFVDGVHGFGADATPISELGCDFLSAGTHKWMFAPRGTGMLYGRREVQDMVTPTIPTFTGRYGWGGRMTPGGFKPFEHRWAAADAFRFHLDLGPQRIANRIRELSTRMKEGLAAIRGVSLVTPLDPTLSAGIVCFTVEGRSTREVVRALGDRRIIASATPYATSYPRFTPAIFNTPEEVDRAVEAVRALA
jgi:isopenicillin-N epimerase